MNCPGCGIENPKEASFCRSCGTSLIVSTESGASSPKATSSGFVGRQREMGLLTAALEDALSGQGRLVMLVGEPGIGKTRTAQELAIYAQKSGMQVWRGRCYEEQGMPPYWPWVQALRPYVREQGPEQLRSLMGSGASDIAEILPGMKVALPDLPPPAELDSPEYARFRLFDSISSFLKSVSQTQPLILVLDDLHWADKPSILLMQFVATEMNDSRLLVVGCYRDVELSHQHPLSTTLAQLSRESVFRKIVLRGLSLQDVGRFIEATAGVRPSQGMVETIYSHTEGNPFFITEVIRSLREQGELNPDTTDGLQNIRIPEGVREVIGQRLHRLSDQCKQTLTIASVIGREFEFRLLSLVSGSNSEEQLLAVMDEALAAHLIEELPGRAEGYQFSHVLIQETLASELSAARRVRLHARIGQTLEDRYGADAEIHATELAHHFVEAEPVFGPEKLVRYSLLAGEQALATHAWEEALQHFQIGLEAKKVRLKDPRPAKDADEAALLFALGRAQAATLDRHQMVEAVGSLKSSFDYYADQGDVARTCAVAMAGATMLVSAGQRSAVVDMITRSLALVPGDSREAGYLLSRLGEVVGRAEGDYCRAQEPFSQALTIARHVGDAALERRVLAQWANTDHTHLRHQECLEKCLRVLELARVADEPYPDFIAHFYATAVLGWVGELEAARRHAAALLALSEKFRHRLQLASALWRNEMVSRLAGDWQAAREFSDRALAIRTRDPRLLSTRVELEYQTGESGQGNIYLGRLVEVMRQSRPGPTLDNGYPATVLGICARITGVDDYLDLAETVAKSCLSSPSVTPLVAIAAEAGLALLAVFRSDVEAAREGYGALESRQGTMLPPSVSISADRLLGLLSVIMGQLDQAVAHFEDALTLCRKAGYRPELAWSLYDYAHTLLARNLAGDRHQALVLLCETLEISTKLGMQLLMELITSLWEKAQLPPDRALPYPDGLTEREVEVLRLVATGKRDREIAELLFISVTTVSTHVRNILNKINASNRTEATAYAAQRGLV